MTFLSRAAILLQSHPLPPDPFLAKTAGLSRGEIQILAGGGIVEKAGRDPNGGSKPAWLWRRATGHPDTSSRPSARLHSLAIDQRRDLAEVAAYLAAHPGATTFDVALCCHMGDSHARRLIRQAKGI